jgi:hypothetical protein
VSITKVVVFFTTNPIKLVSQFSEFSTNFYAFYKFLQKGFTIADPLYTDAPGKNQTVADRSLVRTKHPVRKLGLAIESLAVGGGGLAGIRRLRRRSRLGKRRGVTVGSPRVDGWPRLGRRGCRRGESTAAGGGCRGGTSSGEDAARGGQQASQGCQVRVGEGAKQLARRRG